MGLVIAGGLLFGEVCAGVRSVWNDVRRHVWCAFSLRTRGRGMKFGEKRRSPFRDGTFRIDRAPAGRGSKHSTRVPRARVQRNSWGLRATRTKRGL
mmetsp:Transcript_10269/g.38064  ORF Transcript_10269/g.38064 Transcript_10269/m.38064 type:complete len:96 (+) Transcript_10269:2155-2442(+)